MLKMGDSVPQTPVPLSLDAAVVADARRAQDLLISLRESFDKDREKISAELARDSALLSEALNGESLA